MTKIPISKLDYSLERSKPEDLVSDQAVNQFCETGAVAINDAMYARGFGMIRRTCKRLLRNSLLTKPSNNPGYHKVDSFSFSQDPNGLSQSLKNMAWYPPELSKASDWSEQLVRYLGQQLIEVGQPGAGSMLADQRFRSVVVYGMRGEPGSPAIVGANQTDLQRVNGVNLVLNNGPGIELLSNKRSPDNSLAIFANADVAEALGIKQPSWGYLSEAERFMAIFTNPLD